MASRAIWIDESVSAEDIDPNQVECPRCHGRTLIVHGNTQVGWKQVLEEGKVITDEKEGDACVFEMEFFECLPCTRRFRIRTREVMALELRAEELRQMVITATGKDPFGLGKPS